MAKQRVIAGLKCPPEVEALVMMAKAIPRANAQPISKREPKTVTPRGWVALRNKEAVAAMPGKLLWMNVINDFHDKGAFPGVGRKLGTKRKKTKTRMKMTTRKRNGDERQAWSEAYT